MFLQFTNATAGAISGVPARSQIWVPMDNVANLDVNATGRIGTIDFISAAANPFANSTVFTAPQPAVMTGAATVADEAVDELDDEIETSSAPVAGQSFSRWWINGADIGPVMHTTGNQLLRPDGFVIRDLEGFTNAGGSGVNLNNATSSTAQVTGLNALTQQQRDDASIYGRDGSTWFVQRGPAGQPAPVGPNSGLGRFTSAMDFRLFKVYIPAGSTTLTPITLGTNDSNSNTTGGAVMVNAAFGDDGSGNAGVNEGGRIYTRLIPGEASLTSSPLMVELVSGPKGTPVLTNQ